MGGGVFTSLRICKDGVKLKVPCIPHRDGRTKFLTHHNKYRKQNNDNAKNYIILRDLKFLLY
jgi:hypothetical protein